MSKKNRLRDLSLRIKYLYLLILVICLISIALCFYYKSETGLEISFGALSGIVVTLVASFTSANYDNASSEFDQLSCDYLLSLLLEAKENSKQAYSGISVYANERDDGLNIGGMIKNAEKRVWILGTDLSNFVIKYGDDLTEACTQHHDIHVRILSIHPQNLFCHLRCSQIGWDDARRMSSSINEACQSIKQIEKKIQENAPSFHLDLRLYFAQPTVRIYLIDDTLVISHFINGVRSSQAIHVACDVKEHNNIAKDFLNAHFEDVWNDAVDINKSPRFVNSHPVYAINKNGTIVEYTLKKRPFSTRIRSSLRSIIGKVNVFLASHLPKLITPVFFSVLAVVVLVILENNSTIPYVGELLLNDYLTNMSLGFISGSLLSSIEYIIQVTYESNVQRLEKEKRAQVDNQRYSNFSKLLGSNFKEYGVLCCSNRNAADIKKLILSAKKRVWIYATNNKYISSLDVDMQLKNKDLDVRFLMLSPKSLFVSTRFSEIPGKLEASDFAEEISANLQQMLFRYKRSPVKMRLYYDSPTFMMYLIDDILIISPILRQGRARDQVHFIFDLHYPDVRNDTADYIKHFSELWKRAEQCTSRNIKVFKSKSFITIIGDNVFNAVPQSVSKDNHNKTCK